MTFTHTPTHTWRDFLIHIATIVVGLIIAVGLEQAVERIHQHYELRETREALHREREANHHRMELNARHWLEFNAALRNDLLVLYAVRHQPGIAQVDLPGDLNYNQYPFEYDHAVWDAAEKNGIIRLMPLAEANEDQSFYELANEMSGQSLVEWDAVNDQRRFLLVDSDPTHLTPDQLSETVRLTQLALEKHVQFAFSFGRLAEEFPDMPQTLTYKVVKGLLPTSADQQVLAAAHERTASVSRTMSKRSLRVRPRNGERNASITSRLPALEPPCYEKTRFSIAHTASQARQIRAIAPA